MFAPGSKRKYSDGGESYQMGMKQLHFVPPPPYLGVPQGSTFLGAPQQPGLMYGSSYGNAATDQLPPFPVVKLRGLPFECTEDEVQAFFHGLNIIDILFINRNGRFSGEAFCVLSNPMQVDLALERNMKNMHRRYVEVFRSKRQEYYSAVEHEISNTRGRTPWRPPPQAKFGDEANTELQHTGILRLRGLPYSTDTQGVVAFFKDFNLTADRVHIVLYSNGKSSGEAFVEFSNPEESKSAMRMDKMTIGARYIELFPATRKEMEQAVYQGR